MLSHGCGSANAGCLEPERGRIGGCPAWKHRFRGTSTRASLSHEEARLVHSACGTRAGFSCHRGQIPALAPACPPALAPLAPAFARLASALAPLAPLAPLS